MRIDIFSDTVCPWCFIGKRRLERALAARPQPDLSLRWRAFQLNPDLPAEGMERGRYLDTKFGGARNADAVYAEIKAVGESEGIAFAFDRIACTPNTLDSHRLIRLAETHGRQDETVEALFTAYFLRGEDIGDHTVLAEIAAAAGIDAGEARAFLASEAEDAAVRADDAAARHAGISGVPCFLFDGQYALAGAHEPEVLFRLFDVANQNGGDEGRGPAKD